MNSKDLAQQLKKRSMSFNPGNRQQVNYSDLMVNMYVCACVRACVCVCVLAVNNKARAQRISNREFKLWTFLQGTESRVATFLAETCVMSHQSPTYLNILRDLPP